jgi:hypothetical protein
VTITWTRRDANAYRCEITTDADTVLDDVQQLDAASWQILQRLSRQQGCLLGVLDDDFRLGNSWGLILVPPVNVRWIR